MTRAFADRFRGNRPLRHRKSALLRTNSYLRPLRFETLEDRRLLATITVDTLLDENDGIGVGAVSLRDAINDADPDGSFTIIGDQRNVADPMLLSTSPTTAYGAANSARQ